MNLPLILGSQSPRRKEILGFFSIPFTQAISGFDEEAVPFQGDPVSYVKTLSEGKSAALASHYPDSVILTADTVVYQNGKIFNKPANDAEALQMLDGFVGSWQSVFTSITVRQGAKVFTEVEETKVLFNTPSKDQLRHYHKKLHSADFAGGYGVQMAGSLIINRIEGCFYNIMGLPINTLSRTLAKVDIDLWCYLK